jgi:hypothetical protein
VSYAIEFPTIEHHCVKNSRSFCYGTGWPTSRQYAPNKAAMGRSRTQLRAILAALSK